MECHGVNLLYKLVVGTVLPKHCSYVVTSGRPVEFKVYCQAAIPSATPLLDQDGLKPSGKTVTSATVRGRLQVGKPVL